VDRFDERLRAELRREFDSQAVVTPPPHRARYARRGLSAGRPPVLRAAALVTAACAVGVLIGLAYRGDLMAPGPGRQLGALPPNPSATATTAEPSPSAAKPSPSPSGRPAPGPRRSASPSPASVGPALADDFEADPVGANPPSGWHVDAGQWTGVVASGSHVVRHGSGQPLAYLSAGSPQWSDYAVSADVNTDLLDLGYAGVAGRYQGPGDAYECDMTVGGQLELRVVRGGEHQLLGAAGVSISLSGIHTVRLEMRGSQLTCSLDGVPLVRATDTTFAAGRIALFASAGELAEFDNVRVSG
jgi:hypothetical protein